MAGGESPPGFKLAVATIVDAGIKKWGADENAKS